MDNQTDFQESSFSLDDLKRLLLDGKWIVLASMGLSLIVLFLYSRVEVHRYIAKTKVAYKKVETTRPLLNQLTQVSTGANNSVENFLPTLNSRSFMQKVGTLLLMTTDVQSLRFENARDDLKITDWAKWIATHGFVRAPTTVVSGQDLLSGSAQSPVVLQNMVKFLSGDQNQMVLIIEAQTTTPDSAALLANKVADAVLRYTYSSDLTSVLETKLFIERELKSLQERLEKNSATLVEFKRNNEKIALPQAVIAMTTQISEIEKRISDFNSKLRSNKTLLSYYELKWQKQKNRIQEEISNETSSPKIVEKLTEYINELKLRRLQLLSQGVSENHEEIKAIDEKITQTKKILGKEAQDRFDQGNSNYIDPFDENEHISKNMSSLREENKKIEVEMASLKTELETLVPRIKGIPQKELELANLEMRSKLDTEMYMNISRRYQEVQIQEAGIKSEWQIIEKAVPQERSLGMSYVYRYLLGLIFSFCAAIVFLLLSQAIRAPIRSLQSSVATQARYLGTFPRLEGQSFTLKNKVGSVTKDASKLLSSEQSNYDIVMNSVYGAAFNLVEASQGPQVILISSAATQEGKSVYASNLALSFASMGLKTLLIDGHFQSPELQNFFKIFFTKGIVWSLSHKNDPRDFVVESKFKNLSLLPVGSEGYDLKSVQFAFLSKILLRVRKGYDVVIIDGGPIRTSSVAMLWASLATDIVMVARHGKSLHHDYEEAVRKASSFKSARVWKVLNDSPLSKNVKRYLRQSAHVWHAS